MDLPLLHDPDGHEVRFYTVKHHTDLGEEVVTVHDPRETAEERDALASRSPIPRSLLISPIEYMGSLP